MYKINSEGQLIISEGIEIIEPETFRNNNLIKRVTFPSTIKKIGRSAFLGCTELVSIELEEGIEVIDTDAFNGCGKLKSITFPKSLKFIEAAAFYNCSSLIEIKGGESIELIGPGSFEKTGLNTYTTPPNLKEITYNMLGECYNLQELYCGDNMVSINSLGLIDCTQLRKISIGNNLLYIPELAFEGCTELEEIEIRGTYKIRFESFKGKDSIKIIIIDGVEYSLSEKEKLFSIQKKDSKIAIVIINENGQKVTIYVDIEKGIKEKTDECIYLSNDGSKVKSINSIADISIEKLKQLKEDGEEKIYVYGATRDLKPSENEIKIEYDLYNIDQLIEIKNIIEEIKSEIIIPPEDDKDREKKIYAQIVKILSRRIRYDFYGLYIKEKSEEKRLLIKETYEKITKKNWNEYLKENEHRNSLESIILEDGNLLGLINGRSTCRGNVEIIRNIAEEFGIETVSNIGNGHVWTQVKLDGVWYDDDFTNYQEYLSQGRIVYGRFLCGRIDGVSEFSKMRLYSKIFNRSQYRIVGESISIDRKRSFLNYHHIQDQNPEFNGR